MPLAFHPGSRVAAIRTRAGRGAAGRGGDRPRAGLARAARARGHHALSFSPDGRHLAVSQADQRVQIWDLVAIRRRWTTWGWRRASPTSSAAIAGPGRASPRGRPHRGRRGRPGGPEAAGDPAGAPARAGSGFGRWSNAASTTPRSWWSGAVRWERLGHWRLAAADYRAALARRPDRRYAVYALARCLVVGPDRGDPDEAVRWARIAVALRPDTAFIARSWGRPCTAPAGSPRPPPGSNRTTPAGFGGHRQAGPDDEPPAAGASRPPRGPSWPRPCALAGREPTSGPIRPPPSTASSARPIGPGGNTPRPARRRLRPMSRRSSVTVRAGPVPESPADHADSRRRSGPVAVWPERTGCPVTNRGPGANNGIGTVDAAVVQRAASPVFPARGPGNRGRRSPCADLRPRVDHDAGPGDIIDPGSRTRIPDAPGVRHAHPPVDGDDDHRHRDDDPRHGHDDT